MVSKFKILYALLFYFLITQTMIGQPIIDYKVERSELPVELNGNDFELQIYNSSKGYIYSSIENRLGLECGKVPKDKLVLGSSDTKIEVEDRVNWFSSKERVWIYDIDPINDWDEAEQWIENDTLKWFKIFKITPTDTNSISLDCYYKISKEDSILIGTFDLSVKEIPRPQLKLRNKYSNFKYVSKEELISVSKLDVESEMSHRDRKLYTEIVHFDLVIQKGKNVESFKCYGNYLTIEMKRAINNAKTKSVVEFRNIYSEKQNFDNLKITLK